MLIIQLLLRLISILCSIINSTLYFVLIALTEDDSRTVETCFVTSKMLSFLRILNSFFIEAWILNSLPNQQGDFSLFETSRL